MTVDNVRNSSPRFFFFSAFSGDHGENRARSERLESELGRVKCTSALFIYRSLPPLTAELAIPFRLTFVSRCSFLSTPAPSEFKVVSDARVIRLAQGDEARENRRSLRSEGADRKIKRVRRGSHISFEVGKPTFRVLTLPSAAHNFPENYFTPGEGNPY